MRTTDWDKRLRRLVALAEDQAGTPEGDLASRLAREIVDRRNASFKDLSPEDRDACDPFVRRTLDLGGRAWWRRRVAGIVARHCQCLCSFAGAEARLSGRRSGVLVAEHLYRIVSRAVALEQAAWLGQMQLLEGVASGSSSASAAANDFAQSAVLALESRLAAVSGEAQPEITALVRSETIALHNWLNRQGVRIKAEVPFPFGWSAAGYDAGCRIPLRRAVEGEEEASE